MVNIFGIECDMLDIFVFVFMNKFFDLWFIVRGFVDWNMDFVIGCGYGLVY